MAREVKWTKSGKRSLDRVVRFLEEEWNEEVTSNFVIKVFHTLESPVDYPSLGTIEVPKKGIRGIAITKHNRLFYRVTQNFNVVLNVFDNRSGKQRKNY